MKLEVAIKVDPSNFPLNTIVPLSIPGPGSFSGLAGLMFLKSKYWYNLSMAFRIYQKSEAADTK